MNIEKIHQITVTNHGDFHRWYNGFDPIMGENVLGVHTISYPRISDHLLSRILIGTPEEIQSILSSLSYV